MSSFLDVSAFLDEDVQAGLEPREGPAVVNEMEVDDMDELVVAFQWLNLDEVT